MATSYDLNVDRGSYFSVRLAVKDSTGSAYNLSGYSTSGYAKFRYSSSGSLANLNPTVVSGDAGSLYASGYIDLYLAANSTTGVPITQGVYDVEIYSGTYHEKVIKGYINVIPEVTRLANSEFTKSGKYL